MLSSTPELVDFLSPCFLLKNWNVCRINCPSDWAWAINFLHVCFLMACVKFLCGCLCYFLFLVCWKLCFLHAALQVSPDVTAFLSVSLFFLSAPFLANLFSVKAWISQTLTAARRKGIGRLRSSNLLRLFVASRLPTSHPPVSFSSMLTFFSMSHPSQ